VFDQMVQNGEISTRGLKLNNEGTKPESSIMAELVFDVNTEYFETQYAAHGYASGYDFAKAFYAEAYKMAVEEVGDEKYILSAIMHADERNKGLSDKLGYDVYHPHLHVVYIPVVQKEIKWTKRCKDPALVGTVKEVINQVNHSKKWECEKVIGEDGKERLEYSYSKLQDRYHDFMKAAGFVGFERGKAGSTAEHLTVLEYKAALRQEELAEKEKALAATEKELEERSEMLVDVEKRLVKTNEQLAQKETVIGKLESKEKELNKTLKGQILTGKQIEKIHAKVLSDPNRSMFSFGKGKEGSDKLTILRKDFDDIAVTAIEISNQITKLKKRNKDLSEAYHRLSDEEIPKLKNDIHNISRSYAETKYKNQSLESENKKLQHQISSVPQEVWERINTQPSPVTQHNKQHSRGNDDNR